jgi:hypothetical protein
MRDIGRRKDASPTGIVPFPAKFFVSVKPHHPFPGAGRDHVAKIGVVECLGVTAEYRRTRILRASVHTRHCPFFINENE